MKKNYSFKNVLLDSKGFALAETLIVSLFLMTIFTIIFTNIVPITSEYEKRENYDDVDGKYRTYWIKRMIEDKDFKFDEEAQILNNETRSFSKFNCTYKSTNTYKNGFEDSNKAEKCKKLIDALEVFGCQNYERCGIYITKYRIGNAQKAAGAKDLFQDTVRNDNTFRKDFKDYVRLLPEYSAPSPNGAKYRVIVIYYNNNNRSNRDKYYSFATMEVLR